MKASGNEQYKHIIKFTFSLMILFIEVGIYAAAWLLYYNQILEKPFWRRGNWLVIALYCCLLLFFMKTYGGFRVGYLKTGNLIYSEMLSVIFVNMISYAQISLMDMKLHSPGLIISITAVQFAVTVVWVIFFQWFYRKIFPPKRMLLVSGKRPAFHLMEKIHSREDKYYLAGAISISVGIDRIMEEAKKYDAVIISDVSSHERNLLMKKCFEINKRTYTVPKLSDILLRTSEELDIFDSPLLLSRNDGLKIEERWFKRFEDIVLSLMALIITFPLFIVIGCAIKLTDRGPIFYKQKRLTLNGKEFEIYKFRTMIQDAEKQGEAVLAAEGDKRILPVGRILRRARLDELPQLWNILKGDMSMVGPRPERPELMEEIVKEIPEFTYRLKVKAGLTGYAQIYGKYNTTAYDKLKLDLFYIRKYSVLLDWKLMLMTPKIMFMKESTEGVHREEK